MTHFAARIHAFFHGLFSPDDSAIAKEHYDRVKALLSKQGLQTPEDRQTLAFQIAENVLSAFDEDSATPDLKTLGQLTERIFNYENMFLLPRFDWSKPHSTSEYWELKDALLRQQGWLEDFDETIKLIELTLYRCLSAIVEASPALPTPGDVGDAITVPTDLIRTISDIHGIIEAAMFSVFDETLEKRDLFSKHRQSFEFCIIAASGGNPHDPHNFSKTPRYPTKSDIQDPVKLVDTYIGRTPICDLFDGSISFAIPSRARFEHHHIVAGSGHGKTQTLQYLIAKDLEAVARQERTVIILDSQGDLIRNVSNLKIFAPGQPLHDRVVIIDPTDVEWPVSLNLFDVGLERLDQYSQLDRERLTNSILELYDFVLGSLLSAEMTQKQNVIFRYVTRLMLHIPNATIHTFRELMEPKSEIKFAEHIAKLTGTARKFFETEFSSREFEQTKKQVLRRLWGILENQTFERMFSHPRSKLDLFTEMNEGKVILINTAKDLLKESGTEIFGRFFIALIAQAAQERATLPTNKRMPTYVYIDEAADYFDRNIAIILSSARKYNVGMVLAHQYLGQLEPRLQEAFSANTSIKFVGGVSARDARALAPMMSTDAAFIEAQPKGSFAAYIRGVTKSALPLKFPFGHMEEMPQMTHEEREQLQQVMRDKYAVHYTELVGQQSSGEVVVDNEPSPAEGSNPDKPNDPDIADTSSSDQW